MAGIGALANQIREAERQFGPIGVVGVYGVGEVIATDRHTATLARPMHRLGD